VPSATVARAEDAMFLIESGSGSRGESVVAGFTPGNAGTGNPVALIFFGNGSANLSSGDKDILRDVAQLYNQRGGGRLRIVGHASSSVVGGDPVKQRLANFKISVDRSSAVARALTDFGVPAGIAEIDAVSDNAPLLDGGEAADRRVEIYLN
jgi:outer membrane protein OmpA-like peptidoglycan-associated protein